MIVETPFDLFDRNDPKNQGRPLCFDINLFIEMIHQLVNSDEVITALDLLNKLPAWYRANPPPEIESLKAQILSRCMSVIDYVRDDERNTPILDPDDDWYQPRLSVIQALVESQKPLHIVDLGPSNWWLRRHLQARTKTQFTYEPLSLSIDNRMVTSPDAIQNVCFAAMEVIEHLWHPKDIYQIQSRHAPKAQSVVISTPKYALGGGAPNWETRTIGHVRTYTEHELLEFCQTHWKSDRWDWEIITNHQFMVACGLRIQ